MLSRIDGQTSWKLLREIGGMTPGEVDICVEEWLLQGYIDIDGRPPRVKRRKAAIPESPKPTRAVSLGAIDESLIDPSLDLDEEHQRELLEVEQKLACDAFTLLGVSRGAKHREIKRAYFSLSKRFHPDRYFRKNTGEYGDRLHKVFKAISAAYEGLNDPARRKEIEASLVCEPRVERFGDPGCADSPQQVSKRTRTAIERLRQRMSFRVSESVRDEKSARGEELFKVAQQSERMGRLAEAAANMRLAVAFDPSRREFKQVLGRLQAKIAHERIETLLAEASSQLDESEKIELHKCVEELRTHRPEDPVMFELAARVYVELGDPERSEDHCRRALEIDPGNPACHRTMARVHVLGGNKGHAVSELEKTLEIDSGDGEAHEMLQALRGRPQRVS